jgi:hypothetical protein
MSNTAVRQNVDSQIADHQNVDFQNVGTTYGVNLSL